jgi:hypothetical protein
MWGAWLTVACSSPVAPSAREMGPSQIGIQPCPTSGPGAVTSAGACWTFSPASSGASRLGQNATRLNYALEPSGSAKSTLVVLLNGTSGSPSQLTIDPGRNLFVAALESGNHVVAVAYRSDVAIAQMCDSSRPDCYGASRRTLLTGVFAPGADSSLANIREDEGIIPRIDPGRMGRLHRRGHGCHTGRPHCMAANHRLRSLAGWRPRRLPWKTVPADPRGAVLFNL